MGDHYDVLVIGSGPGGQRAAVAAAKLGRRVAVVEREASLGGAWVRTGTVPSKAMREAALHAGDDVTAAALQARVQPVVAREVDVVRRQLRRNGVDVLAGTASFADPHTVEVERRDGATSRVTADAVILAVGTRPARLAGVDVDGVSVVDSDSLLALDRVPRSLLVVGAGVIGIEYASIFATLGVPVTVVDKRSRVLEGFDAEVVEALQFHLRERGVTFRFGEAVASVSSSPGGGGAVAVLESGKRIAASTVLYSAGRVGSTDGLRLERAGLEADARGLLAVDDRFRTSVPHVYAVGDVIGPPALAATSMEQGRLAAHHALGEPVHSLIGLQPIGVYTIPELSYVGRTEAELTAARTPYEVGLARWRELARGHIAGDDHGLLKLLVSPEDRSILGVHVFGTGATELVHVGQVAMATGAGVDLLVDLVFNSPTFAEAYKVAALDAQNKLRSPSWTSAAA